MHSQYSPLAAPSLCCGVVVRKGAQSVLSSCSSLPLLWCGGKEGCTVGTLLLQPPPSAGTFVHAVTGQVVSESVSAFLALIIGPWSQEVAVVVVVVVVVVCVCH